MSLDLILLLLLCFVGCVNVEVKKDYDHHVVVVIVVILSESWAN